jgi:molybdopterin converting factor subunit 1
VLLFATYREQAGCKEVALEVPAGATLREVAAQLEAAFPELTLQGALAAINEAYAAPDAVPAPGDTVAFFPPVAGGSGAAEVVEGRDHLFVVSGPLDLAHLHALAAAPRYGAVASFVGTVRSPNAGQQVSYIDYEGYEAMILTQMKRAAAELRSRFALGHLVFAHRLGRLAPGEVSIVIVISSEHRRPALEATHAAIDRLKELLPIWKREVAEGGAHWVAGSSAAAEML